MMKKVCVVTGTRAEYGLLKPVIEKIHQAEDLQLQLVATGTHLSPEFGLTYREIEEDGYAITEKVEMILSSDSKVAVTKSMAVALMGFADCFERLKPDMVVILGDRYEMLMVASAAMVAGIPIAHIHGGEITEGAMDDAIRHSITKMSQLHFASTEVYRHRIIQLGEDPKNVFCVGALGVENIRREKLLSRTALEESIGFSIDENTILVTYHPVTLEATPSEEQFGKLLSVIEQLPNLRVIFTKANADNDGRIVNQMIDRFVNEHTDRCIAFTSLGRIRYLSALQYCAAVVGNSSSGIIEAPSFHIPTVNIGNRQQGRMCADTVIHCGEETEEIKGAIAKAFSKEFRSMLPTMQNPYEKENTSEQIVEGIRRMLLNAQGIKKHFYDIDFAEG